MKFKKILALTVALNCAASIVPSALSTNSTTVYAASTGEYLSDISLETNKGKDVTIYTKSSCTSKYKLSKLDSDENVPLNLYAKVSNSTSKINFQSITVDSDYDYKIYKGNTEIDLDEDVKISSSTSFKIKVYDGNDLKETYTLKVSKESDNDDEDDDSYDDIYLDDLELTTFDDKDIKFTFNKNTTTYNINVANSVTSVKVHAEPEYDDYTVRINSSSVDEDDDWTKKVSLTEGKNEILVKIKDDDSNERTYTLNVTRAEKTQSSEGNNTTTGNNNNNNNNNNNSNAANNNTAVITKPENTPPVFSTTKLGWVMQNNNWYFVRPDGTCSTGWVYSNYKWYYMDTNGVMKTGWVQVPSNNKWYYFDATGAMAYNTIINGYKLGSDGAWINN